MTNRFLITLLILSAAGCSSVRPSDVPELEATSLPSLRLKGFRSVDLIVQSTRSANTQKGNHQEIVDAVRQALVSSLERGGVRVEKNSANKLRFTMEDCANDSSPECVAVNVMLRTDDLNVEVEGTSTPSPQRKPASNKKTKNVPELQGMNKSYYVSLKATIDKLPKSLKRALGR